MKDCFDALEMQLGIGKPLLDLARLVDEKCQVVYQDINKTKGYNQIKVLNAFRKLQIAPMHFAPSYGYGYSDPGRERLEQLFAELFQTEAALVRPQIASGTHALGLALFGILRAGDELVSISGRPYDTLEDIIGWSQAGDGSLCEMGVKYTEIPLLEDGLDFTAIECAAQRKPKMMMLQRSRGYSERRSISIAEMQRAFASIQAISPGTVIMVDNCYGEFVETCEPTDVGAHLAVGSLIKNIGGGIAPTGGYIAGRATDIDKIACRLTTPGLGGEIGSYAASYLPFYQGLFIAPQSVSEALKGAVFAAAMYEAYGYGISPQYDEHRSCIIQTVRFDNPEELIAFVQSIQVLSPVESHVVPEPWEMPGYRDKIIMAAGTFVQGASIELSADAPIRAPYMAYMQGGLVAEQVKAAVLFHINGLKLGKKG